MIFFGIIDLATLSRLNLRHLISANTPCFICKKELDLKFMQKFTVKEIIKCQFTVPYSMTESDHLCADCFDKWKIILEKYTSLAVLIYQRV